MSDTYRRITLTLWTTDTPDGRDLSDLVREAEQGNGVIIHFRTETFTAEQARAHPEADDAGGFYPDLLTEGPSVPLNPTRPYTLRLHAQVDVPEAYAPTLNVFGHVRGFVLPDGSVLKPQVIFERHMESDDSLQVDLKYSELNALGVHFDYTDDEREATFQER